MNQIESDKNYENLASILPSRENVNCEFIINKILAFYLQECYTIEQLLQSEELSQDDKKEFKDEIEAKKQLINDIITYRDQKTEQLKQDNNSIQNKLVFLTSPSENYYIYNDLKDIDVDYYDSLLELFNSIIQGTFKNLKNFTNNNLLANFYEVRNHGIRIVFLRLSYDTFLISHTFIKRVDKSKLYLEQLANRSVRSNQFIENLPKKLENSEFWQEQEGITSEILDKLSRKEMIR